MRFLAAFLAGFVLAAAIDDWIVRRHPGWLGLRAVQPEPAFDEPGGGW